MGKKMQARSSHAMREEQGSPIEKLTLLEGGRRWKGGFPGGAGGSTEEWRGVKQGGLQWVGHWGTASAGAEASNNW